MFGTFIKLIFRSMRHRPVRSWLTIIGIVIGIMLVVIILALGNGIQSVIRSSLQMYGSDLVIVYPGKESNPLVGLVTGQKFKEQDLVDLEKIPGIKFVLPVDQGIQTVEFRGEKQQTLLHVQNWRHYVEFLESSQGIKLEKGRWPLNDDVKEVVLGQKAMKTLFRNPMYIGDSIIIKGRQYTVVGSTSSIGESSHDSAVYMSMVQYQSLTGSRGAFSAVAKILPDANIQRIAQEIRFKLSDQEVVRDYSVITPDKANRVIGDVLSIVELVLMIIALVSLIVGGVGIMNTMYTSVLERTKQIGVMKAIGATNEAILTLFLIESGFIGFIGGFLGITLGLVSAYMIGIITDQLGVKGMFSFASVDYMGLLALLIFTFIVGVLAGVFPARTAAKLEPAEALRYE